MIPNLSHAVKNPVTLTSLYDVVDDVVTVVGVCIGVVLVVVVVGKSVKKIVCRMLNELDSSTSRGQHDIGD